MQVLLGAAALLYGSLSLVGIFAAGVAFDRPLAMFAAIAACGAAYACQIAVLFGRDMLGNIAWAISTVIRIAGAVALVI